MFFTSYSLMLKAFFPLFFLSCFLSVAPHSAIAPESAAVLFLSLLAFVQFATCFVVFYVFLFFFFSPSSSDECWNI